MDTTKWKSVALPIDAYEKVKVLAKENERSIARQISFLIHQASPAELNAAASQDSRHHRN